MLEPVASRGTAGALGGPHPVRGASWRVHHGSTSGNAGGTPGNQRSREMAAYQRFSTSCARARVSYGGPRPTTVRSVVRIHPELLKLEANRAEPEEAAGLLKKVVREVINACTEFSASRLRPAR
jgi:hypothetical protein